MKSKKPKVMSKAVPADSIEDLDKVYSITNGMLFNYELKV